MVWSPDVDLAADGAAEDRSLEARGATPEERGSHLAFVAHEVRNPLSTALWSAELLAKLPPAERAGARGEKLAAMCHRSVARLRSLLEDHFLAERLDAGGVAVRPEALPLGERVEEALGRRAAGSGSASAEVAGDAVALADRLLLDRILDALLGAAGRDGAPVRIEGGEAAGRVWLRVEGAAPPEQGLSDPQRGWPPDPSGRSLALPMARRAARAAGGALRIENGGYVLALPAHRG